MSKPLREYRERTGLSHHEVADLLTERLGRKIQPGGVKRFENYTKLPKAWVQALGLDAPPAEDAYASAPVGTDEPASHEAGTFDSGPAPKAPPGAKLNYPAPSSQAAKRISDMYRLVGSGVAMASQNPGVGAVFDIYAADIANAWVAAGAENKFAARVVALAESGGPMGDLVVSHLVLIGGLLYVSGRAEFIASLFPPALHQFHAGAVARRAAEREAAEREADIAAQTSGSIPGQGFNGSGAFDPARPLADD